MILDNLNLLIFTHHLDDEKAAREFTNREVFFLLEDADEEEELPESEEETEEIA